MNAVQTFASHSFSAYAAKNVRIDQDSSGVFARVPDRSGKWYVVRCVESKTSVHASHCNCPTFTSKQTCGHIDLVQAYWNKIYAPKVIEVPQVEAPVKKARKPRNGLVRKVRNGGLIRVEQKPVAKQELPVSAPEITDISTRGTFGTKAFSLMR